MARPDRSELRERAERAFGDSIAVKRQVLEEQAETILDMAEMLAACLQGGGKLLLCGNGGSAADAQHLAAELLVRYRAEPVRAALPALALALDTSTLTACANDLGFDSQFERMTRAFGAPGDILLGISTSGSSANVVSALRAARELRLHTFGFLGGNGGAALEVCDRAIVVPSTTTARIQETHIAVGHVVIELAEDILDAGKS